jgi:hypothetical protein
VNAQDFLLSTAEHPEYFLALAYSVPHIEKKDAVSSIRLDFTDEEIVARWSRKQSERPRRRLLTTKDTIASAILLHRLVMERGPDFMDTLEGAAREYATYAVREYESDNSNAEENWFFPNKPLDPFSFLRSLGIPFQLQEAATQDVIRAAAFLDQEGLAVDPPFTPDLMVLAGLVPMHFSVRTPDGERLFREIKIDAALWSLALSRGRRDGIPYTDVEFRFRGIEVVRNAISAIADQWLATQDRTGVSRRFGGAHAPAGADESGTASDSSLHVTPPKRSMGSGGAVPD